MPFKDQFEHQEIYPRLLLFALVVVAVEPWRHLVSPALAVLGIAYLAVAVGLWLGGRRLSTTSRIYAGVSVDVAAVTALLAMAAPSLVPLWMLYLMPLIVAARMGRLPLAVATILSVAGLVVVRGLTADMTMISTGWPVLALMAMAFALDLMTDAVNADGRAVGARMNERALTATRDELRRAQIIAQAATRLVANFDEVVVRDIVVESVGAALTREVSLIERSTGQVVGGSTGLADSLLRTVVDHAIPLAGNGKASSSALVPYGLAVRPITDNLVLVVDATDSSLNSADLTCLDELTILARNALVRCAEHTKARQGEQTLRAILDALPAPVAVWDLEGQRILANEAFQTLPTNSTLPSSLAVDEIREEECVVGDPPRTFVVTLVPLREEQRVIALYRDVTRERDALRAKDELIAVIGHELRSPLTSIHGYSQMMARQLGVVQDQVGRLNQMIGDFMIAARLEGGQLPIKREVTDLVVLAKAAADRFRGASQERPLRLDLPNEALVEGDPSRLSQVLDNLLNNAEKYSSPEQEIALQIQHNPEDGEVLISVTDHGIGIATEHLPHLFDRFYRAPSSEAQQVKGLGLGLSIVRDLVAAHGGRVWVDSSGEGQGSTFWVSLPAATTSPDELSMEPSRLDARVGESLI